MVSVGIGIPTYNRLESLKRTIKSLKENISQPYEWMVAVDGSDDGTVEWLKENKYEYTNQKREGVCVAKNKILKRFQNHDYIFIVEDDVLFLKPDVFQLYMEACKTFSIQHFNFLIPDQRVEAKPTRKSGDLKLMYSKLLGGCFSTYTKEIIRKVGGFNPRFKGYGHGHCEYTLRISRARLTTPWNQFAHLVNAEKYIIHSGKTKANTNVEVDIQKRKNHEILKSTLKNPKLVHIPLV